MGIRLPSAPGILLETSGVTGAGPSPPDPDVVARVMKIVLRDTEQGKKELRVELDNRDLALFGVGAGGRISTAFFDIFHNTRWTVQIGYPTEGHLSPPFRFVIKSLRGFRRLQVRAYDDAQVRLDSQVRYRNWTGPGGKGVRKSQVALGIARLYGLLVTGVQTREPITGVSILVPSSVQTTFGEFEKIPQSGLTDAQLLTKMAREVGFIWYIADSPEPEAGGQPPLFFFHPRMIDKDPDERTRLVVGEDEDIIGDLSIESEVFDIPNTIISHAIDPFTGKIEKYRAGNDTTERHALGTSTPIDTDVVDAELLGTMVTFRRPHDKNAARAAVVSTAGLRKSDNLAADLDGLFKAVESKLVKMKIRVVGNPAYRPRDTIDIQGIGKLSGTHYIQEVIHTIQPGSVYTTELRLLRNAFDIEDGIEAVADVLKAIRSNRNPPAKKATKPKPFLTTPLRPTVVPVITPIAPGSQFVLPSRSRHMVLPIPRITDGESAAAIPTDEGEQTEAILESLKRAGVP